MAVSRETYDLVAQAIRTEVDEAMSHRAESEATYNAVIAAMESLAAAFITEFEQRSETFDRERFLLAAGLTF